MTRAIAAPAGARMLTVEGRVTNEDRRWWLVHLECSPDVTPGTFHAWLDGSNTHTTKKLIERNIWTIEQVSGLTSDQIDDLKYGGGCARVDVAWEHARTILPPLVQRQTSGGVESQLQDRIVELRKKRELEKRKAEIIEDRRATVESREKTLSELRESIEKKKQMLRERREAAQHKAASKDSSSE